MNEFDRYPHLMNAVLGIPPWAAHLRTFNNLNTLVAIGISIFVAFSQSFTSGVVYVAIYISGWLIVAAIGSVLAQRGSVLSCILLATVVLVTLNVALAFHFFGVWSHFNAM